MAFTESKLNAKLRDMWREHIPGGFWHRVENSVAIGTFDTFVGGEGMGAWIELKVGGPNAKPDVRPGQPGFAIRLHEACVPAHILMGSPDGTIRLIDGRCTGPDWRDYLALRGSIRDKDFMRVVFRTSLGLR